MKNGRILAQGTPSEELSAENIEQLYGISVDATSLDDDKLRVFMPMKMI